MLPGLLHLAVPEMLWILQGLGLGWHPMVSDNLMALGSTNVGDPSFPQNLS